MDRRSDVRRAAEREAYESDRRNKAAIAAVRRAGQERREHERRMEKDRRINNARANLISMRVYDAFVRGHGAPPPR